MSCRSSNATSAVTSAAHFSSPKSLDREVQSLFHSLKREGKKVEAMAPTTVEYKEGIEKLILRIKTAENVSKKNRKRVVNRLKAALNDPLPDGPTWYATTNIGAVATTARLRTQKLIINVAEDMGWPWNTANLEEKFLGWMNPNNHYEEYSSPDPDFRYEEYSSIAITPELKRALRRLGYQHYLAQPYPVFVYGTLRAGEGNHIVISGEGAINEIVEAKMNGLAIYDSLKGAFPYSAEADESSIVVGDLVWLNDDESGKFTRHDLDRLESFNPDRPSQCHYQRVLKEVKFLEDEEGNHESAMAWVYVASGHSLENIQQEDKIASGNWFDIVGYNEVGRQKDLDEVAPIPETIEGEE